MKIRHSPALEEVIAAAEALEGPRPHLVDDFHLCLDGLKLGDRAALVRLTALGLALVALEDER